MMSDTADKSRALEPMSEGVDDLFKGTDGQTKAAFASRNKQIVEDELTQLRSEKARLEGKIRGYQTLNTLFQEEKLQNLDLKKDNQALQEKIKEMMISTETNNKETNTESSPLEVTRGQDKKEVKDTASAVSGIGKAVDGSKVVSMGTQESGAAGWNGSVAGNLQLSETVIQDSDVIQDEDFIKFNYSPHDEHYIPPTIHSGLVSSDLYGPGSMDTTQGLSFASGYIRHSLLVSHPGRPTDRTPVIDHNDPGTEGGSPLSIHVADDLTNMIEKTRRLEKSERAWKAFAGTLQSAIQEKATKLKVEREERAHSTSLLKRENSMLLQKIKKLEHERDALSPADSVSSETAVMGADWVHVRKQQSPGPVTPESPEDPRVVVLARKVQFLELKNKQLSQANKDWEAYRRISESSQEEKMQELRRKLDDCEKALTDHQLNEEKRQRDIDKILLASKKRCQELEEEREELKYELDQCKDQCKMLEEQVQLVQQQQMNELSELRAAQASTVVPQSADPHLEEIVNEKEALKQQLTIFQEDFDKERADRAKAQADKDTLQSQISDIAKQLKKSQTHQRTSDETLQRTLTENERLQQQVSSLKRQLRSSESSLQKCLHECDQLRQQLHDKMKQIRQQGVITPTQGGQPYYPPSAGPQLPPNWQGPPGMYQSARVENAPELLPGSWQCIACTYVNYPGRTVCEVCGAVNQQQQQGPQNMMMGPIPNINPYWQPMYGNHGNQGVNQPNHDVMRQQLIPRGINRHNDLTTDSGTNPDG